MVHRTSLHDRPHPRRRPRETQPQDESFTPVLSIALNYNSGLPPRLARYLFANGTGEWLHQNPATPTDVMEAMAANGVVGALEHPALPARVLREAFANLEPGNIDRKRAFKAIARHPKCPRDLVQLMAGNPDRFIRREVAWRADLDPFVRAVLARDESPSVRRALEDSRWDTWCRGWTDA